MANLFPNFKKIPITEEYLAQTNSDKVIKLFKGISSLFNYFFFFKSTKRFM